jgi:hypothetical protein
MSSTRASLVLLGWVVFGCSGSDGSGGGSGGTPNEPVMELEGKSESELCSYYGERYPEPAGPATVGSDATACAAGVLQPDGLAGYRQRIDFYREWLGLPKTLEPEPQSMLEAQGCAAMMGAAQNLSHEPEPSWPCFTDEGAAGAYRSNIAIGIRSPAQAIDHFIFDFGNEEGLGHRRWLFAKPYRASGFGFFDGGLGGPYGELTGSCVVVVDGPTSPADERTDEPIPYPPAGAFPAALADGRTSAKEYFLAWSLSWQGASFESATLDLRAAANPVPLAQGLAQMPTGPGTDAASWIPARRPEVGERWDVRIDGIFLDGVAQLPLVYSVTFADCGAKSIFE